MHRRPLEHPAAAHPHPLRRHLRQPPEAARRPSACHRRPGAPPPAPPSANGTAAHLPRPFDHAGNDPSATPTRR